MSSGINPTANHGGSVSAASESSSQSPTGAGGFRMGRNAGKLDPNQHPPLPLDSVGDANRSAQIKGIFVGIAGGVLSAFISRKALNLSKNASYLSGLLAGTGVAYITAAQQLEHNLGIVETNEKGLQTHLRSPRSTGSGSAGAQQAQFDNATTNAPSSPHETSSTTDADMLKYDLQAADQKHHEGGVAGLFNLRDRFSSTRGDH